MNGFMNNPSNYRHNYVGLVFLMNDIIISHFKIYQYYRSIPTIDEGLHLYPGIIGENKQAPNPCLQLKRKSPKTSINTIDVLLQVTYEKHY